MQTGRIEPCFCCFFVSIKPLQTNDDTAAMNSARFVSGHWVVAVLLGCQYQNKLCSSVVWQRRHTTDPNPWQIKPEVSPILSQRWTWKKKHLRSCYMSSLKSHIQMAAYSWSYKDSRGTRKMKMSKKKELAASPCRDIHYALFYLKPSCAATSKT